MYDIIAMIGTSDQPCWLAEACKNLLLFLLFLVGVSPQAACWDPKAHVWSTEGMSAVTTSTEAVGVAVFQSKTVGCFAVVSERTGAVALSGVAHTPEWRAVWS